MPSPTVPVLLPFHQDMAVGTGTPDSAAQHQARLDVVGKLMELVWGCPVTGLLGQEFGKLSCPLQQQVSIGISVQLRSLSLAK